MYRKIMNYIMHLKKEQLLIYGLLAALLVIIVLPVDGWKQKDAAASGEGLTEGTAGADGSLEGGATQWEASQDQTSGEKSSENQSADTMTALKTQLELELTDALSQMEGVGRVCVVLTLDTSTRKEVEKDVPSAKSSNTESDAGRTAKSSQENSEESTVYQKAADGTEIPYVVEETMPKIRGVLVIAEGAGHPEVAQDITKGIQALFGVEAHKIKVVKMKEKENVG